MAPATDPVTPRPSPLSERYALYGAIESGGMATVHFGRLRGPLGFARTVAIKRLHPMYATDDALVAMFREEARLTAHLRHPNIVPTLDVVVNDDDMHLVMEYVHGESLSRLLREAGPASAPLDVVSAIVCDVLRGLHAAHEATDAGGAPLEIVHRDVSPQNILVGVDGLGRIIDFGIARRGDLPHSSVHKGLKGKLGYMAPEQLWGVRATRRADLYAIGVVLWEALTGRPLYQGASSGALVEQVLIGLADPPSKHRAGLAAAVDALVLHALDPDSGRRFATAEEMAAALETAIRPARATDVGSWVRAVAARRLARKEALLAAIEAGESAHVTLVEESTNVGPSPHQAPGPIDVPIGQAIQASRSRHAVRIIAASMFVAVGAGGMLLTARRVPSQPTPVVSSVGSGLEAPAPEAPSATPSARVGGAPAAAAVSAPEPPSPGTRERRVRPQPSAASVDCSPPYAVDRRGIRIYNRRCLQP